MRLAEIEEAYSVVEAIVSGKGTAILQQNLPNANGIVASSCGLDGVEWNCWTGRVKTTQVTMVSHSFGAATTIKVLRDTNRFPWVGQGIFNDVWEMCLKPPQSEPTPRIGVPLLGINSELLCTGMTISRLLSRYVTKRKSMARLLTVRGTVNISQSDFCILHPLATSLLLK